MGQKLTFARTHFDANANNGLGEWKALFVKDGDSNLVKAFQSASASQGLKTMGGVVPMNMEQINHRIEQLKDNPQHRETVEQLEHGKTAIAAKLTQKPAARAQAALTA